MTAKFLVQAFLSVSLSLVNFSVARACPIFYPQDLRQVLLADLVFVGEFVAQAAFSEDDESYLEERLLFDVKKVLSGSPRDLEDLIVTFTMTAERAHLYRARPLAIQSGETYVVVLQKIPSIEGVQNLDIQKSEKRAQAVRLVRHNCGGGVAVFSEASSEVDRAIQLIFSDLGPSPTVKAEVLADFLNMNGKGEFVPDYRN